MPSTLETNLRAYVVRGTNLTDGLVIPGNDNKPTPVDPYASLLLIPPARRMGYPIKTDLGNGTVRSTQHWQSTFSLQFYRKGAVDNAIDFVTYAESENGLLYALDLAIRTVFPLTVERLDVIIAADQEERALVNWPVQYLHVTEQDAGYIDTINWDAEYGPITASS